MSDQSVPWNRGRRALVLDERSQRWVEAVASEVGEFDREPVWKLVGVPLEVGSLEFRAVHAEAAQTARIPGQCPFCYEVKGHTGDCSRSAPRNRRRQPMQPVFLDERGTARFQDNVLVRHLLDNGRIDLNRLAMVDAPQADREQFAQLIGYSVGGYHELSYVGEESALEAEARARAAVTGGDPDEAVQRAQADVLEDLREQLRPIVAQLYGIHQHDLTRGQS